MQLYASGTRSSWITRAMRRLPRRIPSVVVVCSSVPSPGQYYAISGLGPFLRVPRPTPTATKLCGSALGYTDGNPTEFRGRTSPPRFSSSPPSAGVYRKVQQLHRCQIPIQSTWIAVYSAASVGMTGRQPSHASCMGLSPLPGQTQGIQGSCQYPGKK